MSIKETVPYCCVSKHLLWSKYTSQHCTCPWLAVTRKNNKSFYAVVHVFDAAFQFSSITIPV